MQPSRLCLGSLFFLAFVVVAVAASATGLRFGTAAGVAFAVAGVALVIAAFGTVALLIENNRLLRRIADSIAPEGPAPPIDRSYTPSPTSPWPSRKEPPMNGPR